MALPDIEYLDKCKPGVCEEMVDNPLMTGAACNHVCIQQVSWNELKFKLVTMGC